MPHTAVSMAPNGPGILAMRHRGFDQDNPKWDLEKRAILLGYEVTGRDDSDGPNSVGHWKEDVDTRGDLNCANYWQSDDYSKRGVGCWSWGYPAVISEAGSRDPVQNTTGGQGDVTQTGGSGGKAKILPIGMGGNPDKRFKPKTPMIVQPEGQGGGDPDAQGAAGDPGNAGGAGAANSAGSGGQDPGTVDLGGGWQYNDGVLVYNGPSAGQVDSLSGFNGGYWSGGFVGFNGVNNIAGGGSGFAGFSGVRNLAGGGSGFPGFSYSRGR